MKNSHLFWGALFISVGVLVLINNYGTMDLAWTEIWKLWPMVFILWGLIILIKNPLAKTFLIILTAILLAVSVFASIKSIFMWAGDEVNIVIDGDDIPYETSTYSESFNDSIKSAVLNFDAGAGSFFIKGSTDQLLSAVTEGYKNNYNFTSETSGEEAEIGFSMKDTKFTLGKSKVKNKVKMELNPLPIWDMNFDVGAASINFDLSEYRTRKITIDMGAASLNLKIGSLYEETRLNIDAGVSSIDIEIPESSGCEIHSEVSLSSKKFRGFTEVSDDVYRTSNFNTSEKKIYIDINTGISSIEVDRY